MLLRCFLADMNVGYVLDETQLTRYFSHFGTVTDCYLPVSCAASGTGQSYIPPANTNSRAKVFLRFMLHYYWLCISGAGQSFPVLNNLACSQLLQSSAGSYSACIASLQKHKSGRNKGFGFTTFEAETDLERTLQASASSLRSDESLSGMWPL